MIAVVLVYLGLFTTLLGSTSLIKPLAFLGIHTRLQGTFAFTLGLFIVAAGWAFPPEDVHVANPQTQLDQFAPAYQFGEVHSIRVSAPKDRVWRAIKEVAPNEIRFFRALTWIRRLGRSGPESILNAPEHLPILEVATRTGFVLLAEEPNREIVVGDAVVVPRGFQLNRHPTPEDFKAVHEPGFAIATMNFLVQDVGPAACIVTTETRVYATDPSTRRRFALYWRGIYPGSALIRRMWLRAIKRRAEAAPS